MHSLNSENKENRSPIKLSSDQSTPAKRVYGEIGNFNNAKPPTKTTTTTTTIMIASNDKPKKLTDQQHAVNDFLKVFDCFTKNFAAYFPNQNVFDSHTYHALSLESSMTTLSKINQFLFDKLGKKIKHLT
jgi:hypothetical protein